MLSEKRKNKMRLLIKNKTKNGDERRQSIVLKASKISVWYIVIYTVIEIIWKNLLSGTISTSFIDIIRLITTIFVYIFFLMDNKFFLITSDNLKKCNVIKKTKSLFLRKIDERLYKISGIAAVFTYIYIFLFLGIEILYKIISNNSDLIWFDYVLFISMIVIFSILMKKDESYGLPINDQGEILDKESEECAHQRKISYVKQSIRYTVGFFIIGIIMFFLSKGNVSIIPLQENLKFDSIQNIYNLVKIFALEFVIVLLFNFIYGEYKIKKYHKKLKEMED